MMARFRNFYSLWKVKIWLKKGAKRLNAFRTGAKIYLSEKILGVRCTFKSVTLAIGVPNYGILFLKVLGRSDQLGRFKKEVSLACCDKC